MWTNEIFGTPPPRNWPADKKEKARAYVESHFPLSADGAALKPALIDAHYVYEPWRVFLSLGKEGAEGTIALMLEYAIPPGARALSGRAHFFDDDWREHVKDPGRWKGVSWGQTFVTELSVPGRIGRRLHVPIERDAFLIDLAESRRTFLQDAIECLGQPLRRLGEQGPWLAAAICGGVATTGASVWLLAALLAGLLAPAIPAASAAALGWAASGAAAIIALKKPRPAASQAALAGAGIVLGVWLAAQSRHAVPLLPTREWARFVLLCGQGLLGGLTVIATKQILRRVGDQRNWERPVAVAALAISALNVLDAFR